MTEKQMEKDKKRVSRDYTEGIAEDQRVIVQLVTLKRLTHSNQL